VTFEGLRFVSGRTNAPDRAGGVTLKGARATFVDCDFLGNLGGAGSSAGAGLGLYGSSKALVVRARFEDNRAVTEGAAIFAQRGLGANNNQPNELWVHASTFRDNCETGSLTDCTSGNAAGGAILIRNSSARISDSLFENNVAGWTGGAIYAFGGFSCATPHCPAFGADVTVVRSRFVGNRADGANAPAQTFGGAIQVEDCARVRVFHSVFEDNWADWGGAVDDFRARLEISDTVFRGNRATGTAALAGAGGAVLALSGDADTCPGGPAENFPAASVSIARTLFEGGSAAAQEAQTGGCLSIGGDNAGGGTNCQAAHTARCAQVNITETAFFDCTVQRSSAPAFVFGGGFVLNRSFATLTNSVVARNRAIDDGSSTPQGGGGSVREDTVLSMNDVLFSGNTAELANDLQVINAPPPSETNVRYRTATSGSPPDAELLDLPGERAAATALTDSESWLVYGWSGSSATLDGSAVSNNPKNGRVATSTGGHTLAVAGGASDGASHAAAAVPETTLEADDSCPAAATTLRWTTPAGAFLAGFVDQGVSGGGASGNANVTPPGTVTYRRLAITAQGGHLAETTIFVGACGVVFADGFETGNTSRWSDTQG
jgi:predicted outer membrane repeat protein